MRNLLIACVLILTACGEGVVEDRNDSTTADSITGKRDTTLPHPQSNILDSIAPSTTKEMIKWNDQEIHDLLETEIPKGWVLMDSMSGDLNRDSYVDLLVVLKSTAEDSTQDEMSRPLLIFLGQDGGSPELAARNDNVVLCKNCGGIWGDPYDGLAIKNGYFSVEHYGGSNWRWTKIITFKFSEKEKTWLLHRDAGSSYNSGDPEGTETETVEHQEQYGKLKFVDYNYN